MQEGGSTGLTDKIQGWAAQGTAGCHPLRQQHWENSLSHLGMGPCMVLRGFEGGLSWAAASAGWYLLLLLISPSPQGTANTLGRSYFPICYIVPKFEVQGQWDLLAPSPAPERKGLSE